MSENHMDQAKPDGFRWGSAEGARVRRMLLDWAYLRESGGVPARGSSGCGSVSATPGYISLQTTRAWAVDQALIAYGALPRSPGARAEASDLVALLEWVYHPRWCECTEAVEYVLPDGSSLVLHVGDVEPVAWTGRSYVYGPERWTPPDMALWAGKCPGGGFYPAWARRGLLARAITDFGAFLAARSEG